MKELIIMGFSEGMLKTMEIYGFIGLIVFITGFIIFWIVEDKDLN
jgi:hypothetical protein